jgi:arylformamidase
LKPFQFLATGLDQKIWEKKSNPHRYVASLGSVSATEEQVETLKKWYEETQALPLVSKVKFIPGYPMDERNRVFAKSRGESASPWFHTCLSKHVAILESCQKNGWDLESYNLTSHPYHKQLMSALSSWVEKDLSNIETVPDGCLLPSPVLELTDLGLLYQTLAAASETSSEGIVRDLMMKYPEWIGGPGRMDTLLMQKNPGKVFAKEGADGLLAIGICPNSEFPRGLGAVIKIASGFQPIYGMLAISPLLKYLGLESPAEVPKGQEIVYHGVPFENHNKKIFDISPLINEKTAVWPGDKAFQREISFDTNQGSHLTLSHIETTVHVGAHTDAPNHYEKKAKGISEMDPRYYWGLCQVIEVSVGPNELITPDHLSKKEIKAPRLLFKTGTFPNPNVFNQNFAAVSEELVEFLSFQGVILIAVDTPSVDLFDSKTMSTHKKILSEGMAILEGVILTGIPEGVYDLVSLPLNIENGDASPVRAMLRTLE